MAPSPRYQERFFIFLWGPRGIHGVTLLGFHSCAWGHSGLECFPRGHEASFPFVSILRFSGIHFPTLPPSLLAPESPECLVSPRLCLDSPFPPPSPYLFPKRPSVFYLICLGDQTPPPLQSLLRIAPLGLTCENFLTYDSIFARLEVSLMPIPLQNVQKNI